MPRLRKPTGRTVHIAWLIASAVVAAIVTRAAAIPVFLLVFFFVWLVGFGVLARLQR